jgi:hypothetical protein
VPTASSVDDTTGTTQPNGIVTTLSATGSMCVFVSADTHLIVDGVGCER